MIEKPVRYIDCYVPVDACNFRCEYCYILKNKDFNDKSYIPFSKPVEQIAIALSKERFGGAMFLNFCGDGETLLHPLLVPLIEVLLNEHYIQIVTNGTIQEEMDKLFSLPNHLQERLYIKFSFHYLELINKGLLTRFIENVEKAKSLGISFIIELMAADCYVQYIDEITDLSIKHFGALPHIQDVREINSNLNRATKQDLNSHIQTWNVFESKLFSFRVDTWNNNPADFFCHAGEYLYTLSLATGDLFKCYCACKIMNIYDDINEQIQINPVGYKCCFSRCYNNHVFDCLVGVVPEKKSPTYAEIRDRVCTDGTNWLTPLWQKLYSMRICDNRSGV
ncbi:MAG: radical SAM protein [Oscillospiraceae bacterium]|jgi:molybdenum cofactor biosynthesis enzyme MoaA|nr:radical SAM protein [Oscillospiraceae bacterium]